MSEQARIDDERHASAGSVRKAIINYLLNHKDGFGGYFEPLVMAISEQVKDGRGRPTRMKQLVGHLDPQVIAWLSLQTVVALIIGSSGKKKVPTKKTPSAALVATAIGRVLEEEAAAEILKTDKKLETAAADTLRERMSSWTEQSSPEEKPPSPVAVLDEARRLTATRDKKKLKAGHALHKAAADAMLEHLGWEGKQLEELGFDLLNLIKEINKENNKQAKLFTLEERPRPGIIEDEDGDDEAIVGRESGRKINTVVPTDEFWAAVETQEKHLLELSEPRYPPLPTPPKPWTSCAGGGYDSKIPLKLLKRRGRNTFTQQFDKALLDLRAAELRPVLNGINALQETKWCIDRNVFQTLLRIHENGLAETLSNIRETGDAALPVEYDWDRVAALRDQGIFHFAYQLDFRGRAYALGNWLQPQGGDIARALLTFGDAKPVTPGSTAERWLAIHGANMMKRDTPGSPTLDERFAMVNRYSAEICKSAEDPLANPFWLQQAKDKHPYRFLAFCFEWKAFVDAREQGRAFHSRIPVGMDGTCNGFQHFAAILRDAELAKLTNVAANSAPGDMYSHVAEWVKEAIKNNKDEAVAPWRDEYIKLAERQLAKQIVMVIPYGSSKGNLHSVVRRYIRQHGKKRGWADLFDTKTPEGREKLKKFAAFLADTFWDVMRTKFADAAALREELQFYCRLIVRQGMPMIWISPVGIPVMQPYFHIESEEIQSSYYGKQRIKGHLLKTTDKIRVQKQITAASPNFVHALDASHMFMTAAAAREAGIGALRMVHDCYGTHAADAPALAKILREEFCSLYEGDVIREHRGWVGRVLSKEIATIDPPPVRRLLLKWLEDDAEPAGEFDIKEVMKSDYFFS